ncbi:MAG: dipeptide epimerase [Thermoguttaceae bacterium]|nr:dipeptide epimerase [Thermoguttaceae bacterium]MDW8078073.1 dipeptide epimerase [Thermoguttaceae bacterium]
MILRTYSFELPLEYPFGISRGTATVSRTLVVEVRSGDYAGYGEAGENGYYGVTIPAMKARLDGLAEWLTTQEPQEPEKFWPLLFDRLQGDTFSLCAVDCALHDLWGKLIGEPVWKRWGLKLANLPPSDYTIGIDRPEIMLAKLRARPGWPVYKIKLGTEYDLEVVRLLRSETDVPFRVDANAAWTREEAARKIEVLATLGVELVEQPLRPDDWEGARWLYERSALPIIADESCRTVDDLPACVGCFHGINVKLVKCGGLTAAWHLISEARKMGFRIMVGCMTESTIGISAAAQLLPLVDYADLDGAVLLAQDLAEGVHVDMGQVIFPDRGGCGITPKF